MSRFAIVGFVGSLAAACSTDSMRLSENPFSNPFKTADAASDPTATGSIDRSPPAATPIPRTTVRSEPLAPVRTAALPSAPSRPAPSRTAATGTPGWSAAGGTAITVGGGDTLAKISDRYGVPGSAILSANGITAAQVTAGRRLVIPVYSATGGEAPARVVQAAPAPAQARVVSTTKLPVAKPAAQKAVAESAKSRVRPGQPVAKAPEPVRVAGRQEKVAPPVKSATKPEPKSAAAKAAAKAEPARTPEPAPQKAVAKATAPVEQPKVAAVAPKAEPAKPAAREPEATAAIPAAASGGDFRWPARGRVISGFGNGSNEGINIAVPDGTPVKAAGDGVVAYAGSEVKGYGNLVLIRHDNGYVSAYAHNGDLDVKRGQKVARGQTIAKSGQSGNVTSPQLHFEIRKGSTPVDPMRYLASAN